MNLNVDLTDERREQDITPESKLLVCVVSKSGRLYRIDCPRSNFREAIEILHDLRYGGSFVRSGEYDFSTEEDDYEPEPSWIGKVFED
jgi:hypothetical protein